MIFTATNDLLVLTLGEQRCGVPAADVVAVHRAVRAESLPGAPDSVEGIVNVRGEIVPLIDLRRRLGLEPVPLRAGHHVVVVRAAGRSLALRVDRAEGLRHIACPDDLRPVPPEAEDLPVGGVARLRDGLLLVYNPGLFLAPEETRRLQTVLAARAGTDQDGRDG